jgi:hypothetical protein
MSCSTSTKTSIGVNDNISNETYVEEAQKKYGKNVDYQFNESQTHVICSAKKEEYKIVFIQFFVFDISSNKIIYQPNRRFRNVNWESTKEIKAQYIQAIPETTDLTDHYIYYNVETKVESTVKPNRQ